MKTLHKLALGTLALTPFLTFSQTDVVAKWQQQHPEVECVPQSVYDALSEHEKTQLHALPVLIYSGELNEATINSFATLHGIKGIEPAKDPQADRAIKEWLHAHPELKIVKRSAFSLETENVQEELLKCSFCLVLKGEVVTWEDIQLFGQ
jgi:hypothetical protein